MGPDVFINDVISITSLVTSLGHSGVIATSQRRHWRLQFDDVLVTSHRHNDVINDVIKKGVQPIQPSTGQSRP